MSATGRNIGLITSAVLAIGVGCGRGATQEAAGRGEKPAPAATGQDLDKKAKEAIDRGLKFVHSKLQPDGSWEKNPGITGIVLLAMLKSGRGYNDADDPFIRRPLEYLLGLQKADGGVYEEELANYTTSIALQVLIAAKNPKYRENIRRARAFLTGQQLDEGEGYKQSDPGYGGNGYGSGLRPDLSNAQMYADAIREAEKAGLEKDSEAWRRTVIFTSRCQNRSESNEMTWASNDGSAVYSPWESKAGEVVLPDGRKGLRGYGAMTYAFLKTMVYADVSKDDPRVKAAYEWIRTHYTVDENPELGEQGLYYYYHTMAKALKAWGDPVLVDDRGVSHDWRKELTEKLLSLQRPDGSWVNKSDRWWETNPVLVTSYAVLTLEELIEK